MTDLWVRRRGDRVWAVGERPPRPRGTAISGGCSRVTAEIDLCTTRGESGPALRWTSSGGREWTRVEAPIHGVLPWFVPSLVPNALAIAAGGDGATLFPLVRVLRSTDLGATWSTYEVPEVDGERRFTEGHVLLTDGRLLVLVGAWSDDRPRQPSRRHHGFFLSRSTDLGELRRVRPRFDPPLTPPPGNARAACCTSLDASTDPDPVVWTTTWDGRLFASTDDGRTFRELALP